MTHIPSIPRILILLALLSVDPALQAQTAPPIDPAISQLAARLAGPLQKAGVTKVIFADLKGPNGEIHPAGMWLADRLTDSFSTEFPGLQVIARPQTQNASDVANQTVRPEDALEAARKWANDLGADVVVTGTFARGSDGILVSLSAQTTSGPSKTLAQADVIVPYSDAIAALSPRPIPAQKSTIPRAGVGGVGVPACIYCPPPGYSAEGRAANYEGSVVLQVTVTAEGRATDIVIVKDPGRELGQKAVEAVRTWRFKPAKDASGKLVTVTVPIQVTFHVSK